MFTRAAGFDFYRGRKEYGSHDYDGQWGVYDHRFLHYFVREANTMRRPFLNVFFSLSSHHPYSVPPYLNTVFPEGPLPIHKAVRYADYSLKLFFDEASRQPWFDSTLFVITADHSGPNAMPEYQTPRGIYEVPILYYLHGSRLTGTFDRVTQQTDIMPTVLGLLNYQKPFVAFGSNIFDPAKPRMAVQYYNDTYQMVTDTLLLQFNGNTITGAYDLVADPMIQHNLAAAQNGVIRKPLWLLKSYIQQFNHRMLTNQLIP